MREVASELAVAAAGGAGAWCVVLIATTLVLVRHARGWADARLAAPWSAYKAVEPVVDDSAYVTSALVSCQRAVLETTGGC
jgi:hypothetical protein